MKLSSRWSILLLEVKFRSMTHWVEPSSTRWRMRNVVEPVVCAVKTIDPKNARDLLQCFPIPYWKWGRLESDSRIASRSPVHPENIRCANEQSWENPISEYVTSLSTMGPIYGAATFEDSEKQFWQLAVAILNNTELPYFLLSIPDLAPSLVQWIYFFDWFFAWLNIVTERSIFIMMIKPMSVPSTPGTLCFLLWLPWLVHGSSALGVAGFDQGLWFLEYQRFHVQM